MPTPISHRRFAGARLAVGRNVVVAMLSGPVIGAMLAFGAVAAQDANVITIDNFIVLREINQMVLRQASASFFNVARKLRLRVPDQRGAEHFGLVVGKRPGKPAGDLLAAE